MKESLAFFAGAAMSERAGWIAVVLSTVWLMSGGFAPAAHAAEPSIPPVLEPWRGWVLDAHPDVKCPPWYSSADQRACVWIGALTLDLGRDGGRFAMDVDAFADVNLFLPGGGDQWPEDVRSNGAAAAVTLLDARPNLHLAPGHYAISGTLHWTQMPDSLQLPEQYGLLRLSVDGVPVPQPLFDGGRLWLGKAAGGDEATTDTLTVRVFRRIDDGVPLQLDTFLDLYVAGSHRIVSLGRALPEGFEAIAVDSPLPARLESNGNLRVQVEPGEWQLRVSARALGAPAEFHATKQTDDWPTQEIWGFAANRALRVVDVEGATPIDLSQTKAPFKDLPAYVVTGADTLRLVERLRGDPNPAPNDFTLARSLWLSFDGSSYTVRDTLDGTVARPTRLSAEFVPGRITIDDAPQVVTRLGDDQPGVELPSGSHRIVAISELPRAALDSAVGWQNDVTHLEAELHLPPGWRLLWTHGVDRAPGAWLSSWTLWDIFVVVIAAVLALRLLGGGAAVLVVLTLVLVYQEPGAPTLAWIALLLLLALLRVGRGRLGQTIRVGYAAALALTIVAVLGFAIDNFRMAIYPQLEQPRYVAAPERPLPAAAEPAGSMAGATFQRANSARDMAASAERKVFAPPRARYEPNTQIQTGPGVPAWQWRDEALRWSGPVTAAQTIALVLSPPWLTRVWHLLGPILLLALVAVFAAATLPPTLPLPGWLKRLAGPVAAALFVAIGLAGPPPARADIPSKDLLDELERRLTQPPECLPACAGVSHASVQLSGDTLRVRLDVAAVDTVALPLPAVGARWWPLDVRDGDHAAVIGRSDAGALSVVLRPGTHALELSGPVGHVDRFELPFPMPVGAVSLDLKGWRAYGEEAGHLRGGALQFERQATPGGRDASTSSSLSPAPIAPYFRLRRTFDFGLEWRIRTTLERLAPATGSIPFAIPLVNGESLLGGDVRVEDARVVGVLPPDANELSWQSALAPTSALTLTAPPLTDWTEEWTVVPSNTWHVDYAGDPPTLVPMKLPPNEAVGPQFQPLGGESLTLTPTRPTPVPGATITVERVELFDEPGERARRSTLTLELLSSQGGNYAVGVPSGAKILNIAVDGAPQPIPTTTGSLPLPVVPGEQRAEITFERPLEIGAVTRTSAIDLPGRAYNIALHVALPNDRWPLFVGGPRLGPAILYWGVMLVVIGVAWILARIPGMPLTTLDGVLLGFGMSLANLPSTVIVAAWLLLLLVRRRYAARVLALPVRTMQLIQILLALITLAALVALAASVPAGLLGTPEMHVVGNGSSAYDYRWFQDQSANALPDAWILSAPMWAYRIVMLAWSLWLAFAIVRWARWAWSAFSEGAAWRSGRARPSAAASGTAGS